MKKKGKFVKLSRPFWNSYKLFLKGEISCAELQKSFVILDDIVFFKEEGDKNCEVLQSLKQLELKKLNVLVDSLLAAMKDADNETRKAICRKALTVFISNYACFAKGKAKDRSKDILIYFAESAGENKEDEILNQKILEMLYLLISSRDIVKDKAAFIQPDVFKLICIYAALAVSDKEGVIKCNQLGKELSTKWNKSTPEMVTLSILKKRERYSKLPICEVELLEKYSFWVEKL